MESLCYPYIYTNPELKILKHTQETRLKPYNIPISNDEVIQYSKCWNKWNPLFSNREHAISVGFKDIPLIPGFVEPVVRVMLPHEFGVHADVDFLYPGDGYDHEVFYYRPLTVADKLTVKHTTTNILDITPQKGCLVRGLIIECHSEMYDQANTLVAKGVFRWPEFSKRASQDCTTRDIQIHPQTPIHKITDAEWSHISDIWENERVQGSTPLDPSTVRPGIYLPEVTEGPITTMDMIRLHGQYLPGSGGVRSYLLNHHGRYVKDEFGYYQSDEYSHFATHFGKRPQFHNTTARNLIIRMVTNWCGDYAFISKLAWRLVNTLPPEKQGNHFPKTYSRPSYLFKVPELNASSKSKYMNKHGVVPDCPIAHGYISDVAYRNNRLIATIIGWCDDLDGNIMCECLIEVCFDALNSFKN